jgi:segregation and condensation protein B
MAKRKKKGRAKPAAESQTNVAQAEVRPAEPELDGENAEVTTDAVTETQPEAAQPELAQPEAASEAQSEAVETTDAPASEDQPEAVEAQAAEEAPVSEPTESAEDTAASESAEAVEEAPASEPEGAEAVENVEAAEAAAESPSEEPASVEAADETPAEDVWAEDRVPAAEGESEGEPAAGESGEQDSAVWTEGDETAPTGEGEPTAPGEEGEGTPAILDSTQMESIIEGLLFASDRVLGLADFKRLLEERDGKKITAALDSLMERRKGTGIEVVHLSNGWHLRTNSEHARWVSKLLAGKPMRLSRAMMETLAIVAYRQPVTRPEIDEIRGVDCGPVLKTLLDRGLVRIIGKKEDVGRPMLYGTTPEFLRVFNLRELTELPTLREYAELNSEQQAVVDAKHGAGPEASAATEGAEQTAGESAAAAPAVDVSATPNLKFVPRSQLPEEPDDNDPLLDELEAATKDASKVLGAANEPPPEATPAEAEAIPPAPAGAENNAPAPAETSREP